MRPFLLFLLLWVAPALRGQEVQLNEDPAIGQLLRTWTNNNRANPRITGWRVQLMSSTDRQQIEQARNRFAAGVASNLEVVEAQESAARADETFIASLYLLTVERLRLARALGETGEVLPGLVDSAVEKRAVEER